MLQKFLEIISRYVPLNPIAGVEDALSRLDPDKIYVENVRSVLNVSYETALKICERAVRQGFFKRGIEIKCPDGTVAASAESENDLPVTVRCLEVEDDHPKEVELPTNQLEKNFFYKLNDETTSSLYRQTA